MRKIITYQAPNGETINLTESQISQLESQGIWPKNDQGQEYCSVSHGLHYGYATFSREEFKEAFESMRCSTSSATKT